MGLEFLSMSVFWTWYALQPAPLPEVQVVPTKQIIQAIWIEPISLRDESSPPLLRQPATPRVTSRVKPTLPARVQKPQKPLWKAAQSWEIPPILWAGFEGFLAAGLGILSFIKA